MCKSGALSEIAEIISGYAFKSAWFGSGNDKIIRISDVKNNQVNGTKAVTFDSKINPVPEQFKLKEGDVLMALSGATTGKIGVVSKENEGSYLNQRLAIIRGKSKANSDYIKYVLSGNYLKTLLRSAGGAAQPNLSPKDLAAMNVPLPPIKEQKRIAAILDKADVIRRKRRQAIDLTDQLLRSIFLDMFGDPVTNMKGWKIGLLKDYVAGDDRINYGVVQPGSDFENGIPLVRAGDISNMIVDTNNLKLIDPVIEKKYKRSRLHGDEILIACVGSIGSVALVDKDHKGFNIARAVARVRLNGEVNRVFGSYMLSCPSVQAYFTKETRTVAQPTLNIKQITETPIIVPPIKEQLVFSDRVSLLNEVMQNKLKSQDNLNNLFNSLTTSLQRPTKQTHTSSIKGFM